MTRGQRADSRASTWLPQNRKNQICLRSSGAFRDCHLHPRAHRLKFPSRMTSLLYPTSPSSGTKHMRYRNSLKQRLDFFLISEGSVDIWVADSDPSPSSSFTCATAKELPFAPRQIARRSHDETRSLSVAAASLL